MGILGSLLLAFVVSILFLPYRRNDPVAPLLFFFFILFMGGLAAQYWITPFGPVLWGVAWFPVLFVVLIFAMLFSITPSSRNAADWPPEGAAAIGVIAWILLVLLFVAAAFGIWYKPTL
jgi:hypothetical protein